MLYYYHFNECGQKKKWARKDYILRRREYIIAELYGVKQLV